MLTFLTLIAMAFVASSIVPLLVYSTTLALFGLAHVAIELKYIDERFGVSIKNRFAVKLSILLLAVVAMRALMLLNFISVSVAASIEIGLVFCLASSVIPEISNFLSILDGWLGQFFAFTYRSA